MSQAHKVIENLYNCLNPGGLLILTATELALVPENLFELVELCGNLVLRKSQKKGNIANLFQFNFDTSDHFAVSKDVHEEKKISIKHKIIDVKQEKKSVKTSPKKDMEDKKIKVEKDLLSSNEKYKEAELLANSSKYEDAIKICQQAIQEAPLNPRWSYLYGVILFESDSPLDAAKAISRVIYLDHDNIMAYIMLGYIYNDLEKAKLAKKSFKNALMLLRKLKHDDIVNDSGGETVERLKITIGAVHDGI